MAENFTFPFDLIIEIETEHHASPCNGYINNLDDLWFESIYAKVLRAGYSSAVIQHFISCEPGIRIFT